MVLGPKIITLDKTVTQKFYVPWQLGTRHMSSLGLLSCIWWRKLTKNFSQNRWCPGHNLNCARAHTPTWQRNATMWADLLCLAIVTNHTQLYNALQ